MNFKNKWQFSYAEYEQKIAGQGVDQCSTYISNYIEKQVGRANDTPTAFAFHCSSPVPLIAATPCCKYSSTQHSSVWTHYIILHTTECWVIYFKSEP